MHLSKMRLQENGHVPAAVVNSQNLPFVTNSITIKNVVTTSGYEDFDTDFVISTFSSTFIQCLGYRMLEKK